MSVRVADVTARRLAALVADEQRKARLPSLVAAVVRDGHLVWSGTRGQRAGAGPPTTDTQYRIGSITKTFTAVAVMQLRDEGLLDLGDPLERHLPDVGYGDRTLRSLLSHSSGMHAEPVGEWWERSPGVGFAELAAEIDPAHAPHAPGERYHYTNVAFALLGQMVAVRRGRPWWRVVEERILEPLGMWRTTYLPQAPSAKGYSVHHFAGTLTPEPAHDAGAMAPAGQLWSTVQDLASFARFLDRGHPGVLREATVTEMTIPQIGSDATGLSSGYGLGLRLVTGGSGTLVGHTGSMPGFLAGLFVDRRRSTAAICLANATAGLRSEVLAAELLRVLEDNEPSIAPEWVPSGPVSPEVAELLGIWYWGNTAFAWSFDGEEIVVTQLATGEESYRFRAGTDGTVVGTHGYHLGERLEVGRDDSGAVHHLRCSTFVYTRTPYDPAAPIPGGAPGT